MSASIVHSGFDGLKFTISTDIPAAFRALLADAKAEAIRTNGEYVLELGTIALAVRRSGGAAFSAHTGDYGAEWYFLDPENRPANNPGITVDFRAFLLASGGLEAAEAHMRDCMAAFGIAFAEEELRVTRADYAIDLLAPWFEPDREALVVPPGTRIAEHTGIAETETNATGARVTGLRAGAIANRQLAIYDKRAEVIAKGKKGWLAIWNARRAERGEPPLDLTDRDAAQVWRFELRLGSKQLRNKFEMRGWDDLHDLIGDAYADFCTRMRYCIPSRDRNRARWPAHELWNAVTARIDADLAQHRSGVLPQDIKTANHAEHIRMLDRMLLGLFISRAAASGVTEVEFPDFMEAHIGALERSLGEHPMTVAERLRKAGARYRWG